MKLLLKIFTFMRFFEISFAWNCSQDIHASASIPLIAISSPTLKGPINCTTTVTFDGFLFNGFPAGAEITIAQCSNISQQNIVAINNQIFQMCPVSQYTLDITDTNVFKFDFIISTEITFVALLQPIPQEIPTEAPEEPSTFSPTTPFTCQCYPDQNISSLAIILRGPTEDGSLYTSPCAPVNCSTTVNLDGLLSAGAKIIFSQCDGLTLNSTDNYLNLVTNNQNTSLTCDISSFEIIDTTILEFIFQFETAANIMFIIDPVPQTLNTTTSLATSTLAYPNTLFSIFTSSATQLNVTTTTTPSIVSSNTIKWWIIGCICLFLIGAAAAVSSSTIILFIKRRNAKQQQEKLETEMQEKFEMSPLERHLSRDIRKIMHLSNKNVCIDFNDLIGKGSNACVYKAKIKGETRLYALHKCIETSQYVDCEAAVKIPKDFNADEIEEFVRELDALITINHHPHVIAFFGWSMHHNIPCLITELADTDLLTYVRSLRNEDLPYFTLLSFMWQITQALEFIASLLMVHRDVACRNILLINNKIAKLADFGLCCHCDETFTYRASHQKRLPLKWLSIEALADHIFSEKSDVWSFGVLCYEIFSYGAIPYPTLSSVEMLEFIQAGNRLEKPVNALDEIYGIMLDCWKGKPQKRPSFKELGQKIRRILEAESITNGYLLLDN